MQKVLKETLNFEDICELVISYIQIFISRSSFLKYVVILELYV